MSSLRRGTMSANEGHVDDMPKSIKCKRCGFENPADLKFCGNCGTRLGVKATTPTLVGLALLHLTGSAYLLISLIFSALVQASLIFIIPYIISGLLGLYAGYGYYTGKTNKYLKIVSVMAMASGFASTSLMFWIGLEIKGIIGPAWVIFLINAWVFWKEVARL